MLTPWRRQLWHLRHGGLSALREHQRRNAPRVTSTVGAHTTRHGLTFDPMPTPLAPYRRADITAAVILDDFSRMALAYEWNQVEVTPSNWRHVLTTQRIDVLFVESAWHGNSDAWQHRLTGESAPHAALVELVEHCRAHHIPTVFWNKEDPTHHEDFLATAHLFDHVFTTDSDLVPAYKRKLGHDRVGTLTFAAQPAIHNPIRTGTGHHERDIAFAGMYFAHRHRERREQMQMLLGAAASVAASTEYGFDIWSRQYGKDERYQFPAPLTAHVVGSLDYPRMLTAYRAYKVFLNVNTVIDSSTMCARRVFEIAASGTPVVSAPSPAIAATFTADEVPQAYDEQHAQRLLTALLSNADRRERLVHRAQRRIWAEHTYAHRIDAVLEAIGMTNVAPVRPVVSALAVTMRPELVASVIEQMAAQQDVDVELVLITHGWTAGCEVADAARAAGLADVRVQHAPADVPLGRCLNDAVAAASGEFVAKIDDDDVYGPHYLSDQVAALRYSRADVVGKRAHYMHLAGADVTVLRMGEFEHRFTDLVMGPTLLTARAYALTVPFPPVTHGEDTGFLRAVADHGGRIYSADRFNFLQRRRADPAGHTWNVSDADLLTTAHICAKGYAPDLITA